MATTETIKLELSKMYAVWGHMIHADDGALRLRNQQYARALADIPDDLLDAAVDQLIAESEFFPTVAAIRRRAFGLQRHAEGGDVDASEIFGVVLEMAGARGRTASEAERRAYLANRLPERVVDITLAVIRAFGWQTICHEDVSRIDTLRAQWRNTFNAIQARRDDMATMTPSVRGFIAELAQKLTADRARLTAPRGETALREEMGEVEQV